MEANLRGQYRGRLKAPLRNGAITPLSNQYG